MTRYVYCHNTTPWSDRLRLLSNICFLAKDILVVEEAIQEFAGGGLVDWLDDLSDGLCQKVWCELLLRRGRLHSHIPTVHQLH